MGNAVSPYNVSYISMYPLHCIVSQPPIFYLFAQVLETPSLKEFFVHSSIRSSVCSVIAKGSFLGGLSMFEHHDAV